MKTHLIVGASGTVGSEIVKLLKQQGQRVKAITSKRGALTTEGIDKVYVDLLTGEGRRQAFHGVDRAFLLSPGGYADQYRVLAPLIQEAKRSGLEKVVLMTALGANANDASAMRRAEIDLEKSGVPYNIVRPNWFMQNFNTFWAEGIRAHAKIQLPAGNAKVSFIDSRDISAAAASLLTNDAFTNRAFDLTGPAALDHAQVAQAISNATGKAVMYQDIEPAALKGGLRDAGLAEDYVDFLLLIFGFLREGYNARITDSVQTLLGRPARGFNEYARDYRDAWR
jgi:uncharacterized protein YbjT (DUF2867 family)